MVYSQNVKVEVYVKTDHNWNVSKKIRKILVRSSGNSFLKEQLPKYSHLNFIENLRKQNKNTNSFLKENIYWSCKYGNINSVKGFSQHNKSTE